MTDILKDFYEYEETCSCDGDCGPCQVAREKLYEKARESYLKITKDKEDGSDES
jgi:bacterioferritin-associated ferredoxin